MTLTKSSVRLNLLPGLHGLSADFELFSALRGRTLTSRRFILLAVAVVRLTRRTGTVMGGSCTSVEVEMFSIFQVRD